MSNHRILPCGSSTYVRGNRSLPTWANALPSASSRFVKLRAGLRQRCLALVGRFIHGDADDRHARFAKRLDHIRPKIGQLLARHPAIALPEHHDRRLLAEQTRRASSSPPPPTCGSSIAGIVSPTFTLHSASSPFDNCTGGIFGRAGIGPVKRRVLLRPAFAWSVGLAALLSRRCLPAQVAVRSAASLALQPRRRLGCRAAPLCRALTVPLTGSFRIASCVYDGRQSNCQPGSHSCS